MPTTRVGDIYNSLVDSRFEIDGENVIVGFLQNYAKSFTTGLATGKVAETLLKGSIPEISLPLAAISTLLQGGVDYFSKTVTQDKFKPGDVCIYQNGYYPETNDERYTASQMFMDTSEFEPLSQVPRYDICVVRQVVQESEDMYEVYDFAHRKIIQVHGKDMRLEPEDEPLTQWDVIQKLKNKYTFGKPDKPENKFQVGDFVYVRNMGFEGVIADVQKDFIYVTNQETNVTTKIHKTKYHNLMTQGEVEATAINTSMGRKDLRVHMVCYYELSGKLRPVIITRLHDNKATVRAFHLQQPFDVFQTELTKASTYFLNRITKHPEYKKNLDVVRKTPSTSEAPLVTEDTRYLIVKKPAPTTLGVPPKSQDEELDLTAGGDSDEDLYSQEPAEGTPRRSIPTEEFDERLEVPKRRDPATVSAFADTDQNTSTYILVAGGVLAGVLLFMK